MTHQWEDKPVLFLVLATASILVGTVITMVLPFATVNSEHDRIAAVVPYSPLQLAGRDVYIREGCNNCHTQTVRPLVAEVVRYGPFSKSGEFAYDRPHLWGSRRTGPDLARVGGKYPDSWHYRHNADPQSMVPASNMPRYAFLGERQLDPDYTRKSMDVLGFPYSESEISDLDGRTEMDALVAYLQKLGSDIGWRQTTATALAADLENPYGTDDAAAVAAGAELYQAECAACHGDDLEGDIGPGLEEMGYADADLFEVLYNGVPDGGMPAFAALGNDKLWQLVTFIQSRDAQ